MLNCISDSGGEKSYHWRMGPKTARYSYPGGKKASLLNLFSGGTTFSLLAGF